MSFAPTRRMVRALRTIRALTKDGVPPSLSALAAALGYRNKSGAHGMLSMLRERGLVEWMPGHARTLRIVEPEAALFDVTSVPTDTLKRLVLVSRAELQGRGVDA